MNLNRIIFGVFAAIFLAMGMGAGVFFLRMHRDLAALRAQEAASQRRIAAAEGKLREQEKYLDRLRHDPALVERVIRRKLGYAKPQEFVFRFEE